MTILLIALGVLCAAIFVSLFVWMRRSERDVDYGDLLDDSAQTEEERRAKQLGIGLTSGSTIYYSH
jgi:hypothetical protein